MAKYTVTFTTHCQFDFDTSDFEDDFAKSKDELPDKVNPEDPDAVHDYLRDADFEELQDQCGFSFDGFDTLKVVKK